MIELRIISSDLGLLRDAMVGHNYEQCAVAFATRGQCGNRLNLVLVQEIRLPAESDYVEYGAAYAQLKPQFVAHVAKHAKLNDYSLIFLHSHTGSARPRFSSVDDAGEQELAAFFSRRKLNGTHCAVVMSPGGTCARLLGTRIPVRVISVGDRRTIEYDGKGRGAAMHETHDRQVRTFGKSGQRTLQELRVCLVGLGGTGSIAAEQLAHLGVRRFTLIDPDNLETSNLSRVVGTVARDIGQPKCKLIERHIRRLSPRAKCRAIVGDVVCEKVARQMIDADAILCCTDSHASRSVAQQIAYQYLIPCMDVGSVITAESGSVTSIAGRIQMLGPDRPCLWCSSLLNPDAIRREMMNDSERLADRYVQGDNVPAPSVISLNGTVVSLAITMMLGIFTSMPIQSRYLVYDAMQSKVRPVSATAKTGCFICSRSGVLARGDSQRILARKC